MQHLFEITLYLLVVINPVSKIFILSAFSEQASFKQLRKISLESSLVAALILIVFAALGNVILDKLFHVNLYSLKIAGGIILFTLGYNALSKGLFFEIKKGEPLDDIAVVPLASPMIAGPGTITASLSFSVEYGLLTTIIAVLAALALNLMFMLSIQWINGFLQKHNFTGALIRITGLIVATLGVQMVLDGISIWYRMMGKTS